MARLKNMLATGPKSKFCFSQIVAVAFLLTALASAGPITSVQGFLADPNNQNQVVFNYDPFVDGSILNIQSWGYGGSSGAPGGVNLSGNVISAGGFDPIATLFFGTGATATFVAANDDGLCPPGSLAPNCYDPSLNLTGLSAGSYTLVITAFSNFAVADQTGETLGLGFSGGGSFDGRTANFAVDVQATDPTAVPEPTTFVLLSSGLLALGWFRSRKRL
jgi:hypothetical protein